jgi:hypothetical protein
MTNSFYTGTKPAFLSKAFNDTEREADREVSSDASGLRSVESEPQTDSQTLRGISSSFRDPDLGQVPSAADVESTKVELIQRAHERKARQQNGEEFRTGGGAYQPPRS